MVMFGLVATGDNLLKVNSGNINAAIFLKQKIARLSTPATLKLHYH
jgi:hypothetical protein